MKLAIRIFALFVVVAGAAAASTSKTVAIPSHQSATAGFPNPTAGPTCPARQLIPAPRREGNDTKVSEIKRFFC